MFCTNLIANLSMVILIAISVATFQYHLLKCKQFFSSVCRMGCHYGESWFCKVKGMFEKQLYLDEANIKTGAFTDNRPEIFWFCGFLCHNSNIKMRTAVKME